MTEGLSMHGWAVHAKFPPSYGGGVTFNITAMLQELEHIIRMHLHLGVMPWHFQFGLTLKSCSYASGACIYYSYVSSGYALLMLSRIICVSCFHRYIYASGYVPACFSPDMLCLSFLPALRARCTAMRCLQVAPAFFLTPGSMK